MPTAYIPVLIFALLVLSFPIVTLLVFKLIRPVSRGGPAKFLPYECGVPAESNARGRYSARFYVVAMLFVIFDVETIFMFPWAILYRSWLGGASWLLRADLHGCLSRHPAGRLRLALQKGRPGLGLILECCGSPHGFTSQPVTPKRSLKEQPPVTIQSQNENVQTFPPLCVPAH